MGGRDVTEYVYLFEVICSSYYCVIFSIFFLFFKNAIFLFFKGLKGNILRWLKNDGYENHYNRMFLKCFMHTVF